MACKAQGQGTIKVVERTTPSFSARMMASLTALAHPEIIGVDNQQTRINRISQQSVGLAFGQRVHPSKFLNHLSAASCCSTFGFA